MVVSSILKVLGLVQNHQHFVSQRKREFVKLTTEYEVLLREIQTMLLSAQVNYNANLDLVPSDTMDFGGAIEDELHLVGECLEQIESHRELSLSKRANALSLEQWDELISRRLIQKGAAEAGWNKWKSITARINSIFENAIAAQNGM